MTFHYRYRKQIIIGISMLAILIILTIGGIQLFSTNNKKKKEESILLTKKQKPAQEKVIKKEVNEIKVDIKGEVVNPGLYSLTTNDRVSDAINRAGGLTENADVSVINLSKKLSDEMVIIIYSKVEVSDFKKTKEIEQQSNTLCIQKDVDSLKNDACIESSTTEEVGIVNLNTASLEQLMSLSGIGEAKAQEIIRYRDEHGPFQSIEDIKNVSGIGDSLFAKIQENITV